MGNSIYKYIGPETASKVFSKAGSFYLKCSLPNEFNDPYELFLTMDFTESPELIAFYSDVIGNIPQIPVTCFSRSPSVMPMWAHYAKNLEGFVLEIDEDILSERFPNSNFGNVDYQDEPSKSVAMNLAQAFHIGKFRYMHFLQESVFSAAYYTKQTCWSYELERRMVIERSETINKDGLILIEAPSAAIKSIICGPRASKETVKFLKVIAQENSITFLQAVIGKSTGIPYFIDKTNSPFIFTNGTLKLANFSCEKCYEPIPSDQKKCSWCSITEQHRRDAAFRNSYRVLSQYNLLESYIDGIRKIGSRKQ